MAIVTAREQRIKRHRRLRKKVHGIATRPRLCVFRSNHHIYAQLIDDTVGHTLIAASTKERGISEEINGQTKRDQARVVGRVIAERALQAGITEVVFDRGGFRYHGRVQVLAEAAREAGLNF